MKRVGAKDFADFSIEITDKIILNQIKYCVKLHHKTNALVIYKNNYHLILTQIKYYKKVLKI